MSFLSSLTTPSRRPLSIYDWLVSVVVCYACILSICFAVSGVSGDAFGGALFMLFMGLAGPVIGLSGAYYEPLLIPLFVALSAIWWGMFYILMRFALIRPIQIGIITLFFVMVCFFGWFGIAATQAV